MPFQKSYSEQAGPNRQNRSPWQRSHSTPVNAQTPRPKVLQPISDASRNKLHKFQYKPKPDDAVKTDGKEPGTENAPDHQDETPQLPRPDSRLSWEDLINPQTPAQKDAQVSPNERITWGSGTNHNISPSMFNARAGIKRARSSSPISSPADRSVAPAVDVKRLTKAIKSPRADPTLELWDRYAIYPENTSVPAGFVNPSLAHLMNSSPRPAKSDSIKQRGDAQRPTTGSGLNWPKRRKIAKPPKTGSQSNGAEQKDLEAASKSSLVSALLLNVTSSIHVGSPRANSAKSPSPQKRKMFPKKTSPLSKTPEGARMHIAVSDYGDDDLDDDVFIELEANLVATQVSAREFIDAENQPHAISSKPIAASCGSSIAPAGHKPSIPSKSIDLEDEFNDAFGDDIDFEAVELAATQSIQRTIQAPSSLGPLKPRIIQRYLVKNVLSGDYTDQYSNFRPEKIVMIHPDNSKQMKTVHLRASWFDTPVHAGAYVHIIGQFSVKGECVIDDAQNLLILHPDQLISATVVGDSFGCMRRAVLQDRVKATSEPSPPLVYGTMLHEIFQEALMMNNFDLSFLAGVIDKNCEKHVEDLYIIKVSMAVAKEHLMSKMTELSYWAKAFVSPQPRDDAIIDDRNGAKANMAITKLLDVEEHVWSPMYGLKGNIDATVEVIMKDGKTQRTLTVPFEVKTGRNASPNHIAQTALYTLLLSDRYDIDIACGLLYYMENSKVMRIPAVRQELRHMIMQRNQLACHVRERSVQLPPMLKSKHMCGKCYAKTSCFIYHRLADEGTGETSGMGEKFDEVIRHLTPRHQEFFIKWENLLTKEEKESQKTKRELWTMTSAEREKKSRCFADVIIEEGSAKVDDNNPGINRFHYSFIKPSHAPGFSFTESELNVGEPIVVSDEQGHYALAIGYVTAVRKKRISVAVDRRLHNARIRQSGFDEADNQTFASIMEVAPEGSPAEETRGKVKTAPIRYRLDQDEFSNGMATVRNNLVQLMSRDTLGSTRMRELLVDLAPPKFTQVSTQYTITEGESLNVDQKKVIEKVMSAQDYALVLGMPGTGKTTTIAHIIRALTMKGKSVLLTSHTHTAVDNILLKLRSDNVPILRLGAPAKIHPEVQEFAVLASRTKKSFEEIRDAWHNPLIVATTCLGINHPVFLERSFDYCIVDEASQITLPICAGPIRMARKFVLVGDHNQLPPVVRNEEAREGGLDVSLFKLLSDSHPESVASLAHQYRMCEDIMMLSNTLIYNGQLRCGTEALKLRSLDVPNMSALKQVHYDASSILHPGTPRSFCTGPRPGGCWLYDLIESEARVRFIDTDTLLPAVREEAHGKRIVNSAEVRVVSQLVDSLLTAGVPANEIGVMTHYRAQLFMLKERMKHHMGVEMHTTDRFQGRDKEVIVLSLVRSNDACNIGDLLKDWRRINVAFTRAKTKLLVVGSMSTLKGSGDENMLSRFITLMDERNWIYSLPRDALESHHFEEAGTQLTTTGSTQHHPQNKKSPRKMRKPLARQGKENIRPSPKRATIGERALLKDKLITRDILNEMTNGAY